MKPIDWRNAIYAAEIESSTKLVLYTISVHINPRNEYMFPSMRLIAKASGLARSTVQEHIEKAVKFGLLERENTTRRNGGKGANRYYPEIPDFMVAELSKKRPSYDDRPSVIDDDRPSVMGVPATGNLLNKTIEQEEGSYEPPKPPAVTQGEYERIFAEIWEIFPRYRRGNKDKAYRAFLRALTRASEAEILTGVRRYANSEDATKEGGRFAKGAEAWFNADGWSNHYQPKGAKHGKTTWADLANDLERFDRGLSGSSDPDADRGEPDSGLLLEQEGTGSPESDGRGLLSLPRRDTDPSDRGGV